ncbi:MAG TPA: helix-turn-helix domain-containing protein [Candidatus Cybelea sp.]|nr:helix-turn-helix domain-containing protein [Candidatus Cybelea sp.]
MIAIPVSGEVVRRSLRTAAAVAVAVAALSFSLPNLVESTNPWPLGTFGFYTVANVVLDAYPRAQKAGIAAGDRIDYFLMAPNERYGNPQDGLREPPVGRLVSFEVNRHGKRHVARLAAEAFGPEYDSDTASLIQLTAQKAIFLVLVLLGLALVLIRPERLTAAFFLFVAGNGVMPLMYAFLPAAGYAAVMAADDTLAGLGAIGFLGLALYLDPKRQTPSRLVAGIGVLLLAAIVVPIATSDVLELVAGLRPAWPAAGWTSFVALWFCYVAGFVLLLRMAASATTPRSLRLLAALLAGVGALTIANWTMNAQLNDWYFANLPGAAMNRGLLDDVQPILPFWMYVGGLFILRLLGSLLAFYLIVRAGIADAGPVFRRIVAYIIVALLVVAVSTLANLALMPRFAGYAMGIPLEIFAAIAIGYWASGLRDVAGSLSLGCVDAWSAWANGRAQEERDALAQSLGFAERTHRRGVIAEVRAQIAFSSWRNGEDGAFEQKVDALQRVLGGRNMRGIRGFADAATSRDGDVRFDDNDLPEWKARAALVLCARTDDAARAAQLAVDALASADRAGLPSLQVLAAIAVAETCVDRRSASLERAHAIARDAGWAALSKSILALRANSRDIGILQTFVDVRLRKSRPAHPMFHVSFFNAELRVNGTRAPLSEKQLELLLTVASARMGINDAALLDTLWPESEGDAARNSLRVCLYGLRKNAGDARIVTRVGKGFILHQWADVDLWRFGSLLSACRDGGAQEGAEELHQLCQALRAGEGRRATLGEWFFRFEQTLDRRLGQAEELLARDLGARRHRVDVK